MDTLTTTERELVALGAALGSNCVPCIEYHVPEARKAGLADSQIREAIHLADKVRQVPARKVLDVAVGLVRHEDAGTDGQQMAPGCAQSSPADAVQQPCCG